MNISVKDPLILQESQKKLSSCCSSHQQPPPQNLPEQPSEVFCERRMADLPATHPTGHILGDRDLNRLKKLVESPITQSYPELTFTIMVTVCYDDTYTADLILK